MADVIILHGSWHRPAHYDDLAGSLRSRGLRVEVPDLQQLSLEESTALAEGIVAASGRPSVVVGHSFGGITAGTVRGAAALIFLNGWILDVGESPAQLLSEVEGATTEGLLRIIDSDGQMRLDSADAREKLYGDVDEATATRAIELLRPEPVSIIQAVPSHVSWRDTPSVYITGSEDHVIAAPLVARFASRCTTVETWKTSHSPFLSRTAAVADLVHRQWDIANRRHGEA